MRERSEALWLKVKQNIPTEQDFDGCLCFGLTIVKRSVVGLRTSFTSELGS